MLTRFQINQSKFNLCLVKTSNYILHAINYIIAYLFQLSQRNSEKYLNITHY